MPDRRSGIIQKVHPWADFARSLLQGVMFMRESTTYQAILDEGRKEEARAILVRLARQLPLGEPDPTVLTALTAINDGARLEAMANRILKATSWQDLLATP